MKTLKQQHQLGFPRRLLLSLSLVIAICWAPSVSLGAREITDQGIADAIDTEFIFDRSVPANDIDVSVVDGIASLSGTVNNILAKDRATRIAEMVKGVRSVTNRIQVTPSPMRKDGDIQSDVETALLMDPATDSYEITTSVKDGKVTLTGMVDSWTEKDLCGRVAKGVKGVTDLENNIDVNYKITRPDTEIKPEVEKALRWDVLVDNALIDVQVKDGKVTLTGTVGSAAEKRQARYDAWVAGVKSVDDSGLKVERWARDEDLRKNKYVIKSSDEIQNAIKDALLLDPRVLSFNVTPDVVGSNVTLRGMVDNLKAKRAAEQVARNTVGVTYVTNRLKVKPSGTLTDDTIAKNVRDAILRDPFVERYEIGVSVQNGTVYLTGTVDSNFEKVHADDVASRINGVKDVRNYLDVDYTGPVVYAPYVWDGYYFSFGYPYYHGYAWYWYDYDPYYTVKTDAEIKDDIQDELWWSPFVDEDEVNVGVKAGVATLTGEVDTWSERNAAVDNAYEGGAIRVINKLTVE